MNPPFADNIYHTYGAKGWCGVENKETVRARSRGATRFKWEKGHADCEGNIKAAARGVLLEAHGKAPIDPQVCYLLGEAQLRGLIQHLMYSLIRDNERTPIRAKTETDLQRIADDTSTDCGTTPSSRMIWKTRRGPENSRTCKSSCGG